VAESSQEEQAHRTAWLNTLLAGWTKHCKQAFCPLATQQQQDK